ncbi:MAG: glycosyltransferase [Chitinispirillales bacterium]|jgi:glycosyltransferase involved in cell wall biosynthesis|nr:glycosyltransferase [Chitinispirillales bacterium]
MTVIKTKILFIAPHLRDGGMGRVMTTVIRYLDRQRFTPVLALFRTANASYLKDIPCDVQILDLNTSFRYAFFPVYKSIRNIKPDIVYSSWGRINILIALIMPFLNKRIKFIARENIIVSEGVFHGERSGLSKLFCKILYPRFNKIICQCQYMKDDLVTHLNISTKKTVVINNPVDINNIIAKAVCSNIELYPFGKINLLAVGRLGYQKGYDYLLRSLMLLDDNYHLSILGTGELERELMELAKKLDISKKVSFLGFKDNPYTYMANADLLVLSSRYEGFPNVALEANVCGLPVVAFDIPPVAEIIKNGENGILVELGNCEKLAEGIQKACNTNFNKQIIKKTVFFKYHAEKIVKQYEEVFLKIDG